MVTLLFVIQESMINLDPGIHDYAVKFLKSCDYITVHCKRVLYAINIMKK